MAGQRDRIGGWSDWHDWSDAHHRHAGPPSAQDEPSDADPDAAATARDRVYAPPPALPQRILDEVAEALARIPGPGAPGRPGSPWGPPGRQRVPAPRRGGGGASDEAPTPPATPAPPAPPAPPSPDVPTTPPPAADDGGARRNGDTPSGTLTMMVTDIVDSTVYAERLGDRRWIQVLSEHNRLVRDQVARYGGTEVKAQGDGFLVVFASARRAILAAVGVQQALGEYREDNPDTPVEVRVGLHTGEIVDVDGDVFGQNVVVAVRITDHAAPGEIVVSGLTRDLTVSGGDLSFGPAAEVELKGLSEPWRIHRVTWSHAPA